MEKRQNQFFQFEHLRGRVVASSDQFGLILFDNCSGFVSLATHCEGDYSLVMTVGIPLEFLDGRFVHRLHKTVLQFFNSDGRCVVVTTEPTRVLHAMSYLVDGEGLASAADREHRINPGRSQVPVELFSFPRRFDVASMLAVSTAYAVLFAAMRMFGASPALMLSAGGLFAVVGVGQAVLFKGESPRAASAIVGAVYCAIAIGIALAQHNRYNEDVFAASFFALIWGALVGYLAGAMVGGIFLTAEYARRAYAKHQGQPAETDRDG